MAEVAKTNEIFGAAAKLEATYSAGGTPSPTTDAIPLDDDPDLTAAYANDGARNTPPGTTGYQARAVPTGLTGTSTLKVRVAGAGAAYSASKTPRGHVLLRAAGFDATLTSTPGSEKYTYTPSAGPTGYASAVLDLYSRGEKRSLTGIYSDFEIGADGSEIPLLQFALQGLLSLPSDASVPAMTYDTQVGPKSVGAGLLTLGNATGLVLRKWGLKLNREIAARLNSNTAAGHAGFAVGKRTPTLTLTVEASALPDTPYHAATSIDPARLFANATALPWSVVLGATQYNKLTLSGPAAQIAAVPGVSADGPTVLWDLSFQLNPSALGANDELSLVYA
jgi:hypothetical protein